MLLNWADEPEVVSDPYSVLPVCTGKTIRECTAIHLGGRNITRIDHFERFVNLNVLYLNDNRIQRVDNLESCFRLRELYLNNNRVSTLKTESFAALHYLKRLSLSGNRLKNLLETLPLLKHMTQLDNLDLEGNPLAKELNYRLHVIHHVPTLTVLDHAYVTQEERAQAERLYADLIRNGTVPPEPRRAPVRPALAFGKKKPDWSPDRRGSRAGQQSELSKTIIADAERLKAKRAQERRADLLRQYGDNGEKKYASTDAPPRPRWFLDGVPGQSLDFWDKIETGDDFRKVLDKAFPGDDDRVIRLPELNAVLIGDMGLGRQPDRSQVEKELSSWTKIDPADPDPAMKKSDVVAKFARLTWSPIARARLLALRERLYATAQDLAAQGNESEAAQIVTSAASLEPLLQ
ncbi:unnamed protein product (mitochondrion) [Plasmodiophora brassicae]|uniref:U2A'/phosphoprotein 32 family A C-terminal domain-containing protein n=1 Tax=Plasmodiophora brassicae TaxID=37360 RepID=A0A0G4J3I2_PLABS|nr:hypothetical protein PBRA_002433 [Plasmodiophora brassicae]SPQ93642.1 unnamed protein product [Plasmodiophora brassicae]